MITNGKPVNTFYSYQFDKLDAKWLSDIQNYNEQYLEDEDGHKKGISLSVSYEEAYARAFVAIGKPGAGLKAVVFLPTSGINVSLEEPHSPLT